MSRGEVWKVYHFLEILDAPWIRDRALPALERARPLAPAPKGKALAAVVREALPRLRAAVRADEARVVSVEGKRGLALDPAFAVGSLAVARLEALLACAPEPPRTESAFEEVAWALVRSARLAPPVTLGDDWDLVRALIDPSRRRSPGLGALGDSLAAAAVMGSGPLACKSGYALVRARSYATGWNDPSRVAEIAKRLGRVRVAAALTDAVASGIYPRSRVRLEKRLARGERALAKLVAAYSTAAALGAGVFIELELV